MIFFELPAILVAVYGWNFRILQTINAYQKSTQQRKLIRNFFKIGQKFSRGISYSGQIVFFQFLHYTCFSGAICPLQVPNFSVVIPLTTDMLGISRNKFPCLYLKRFIFVILNFQME